MAVGFLPPNYAETLRYNMAAKQCEELADKADQLVCTSTELIYLASLRGARTIVGISDPLHGRSADEIEAALAVARDGLAARRYLTVEADGTLTLDFDVARVVDAVARPRRTLLAFLVGACAVAAPETGARRVFHVRGSVTVSMTDWRDEVRLVPLAGRAAIAHAVLDFWSVADQPQAPGGSAIVPRQTLHAAAHTAATLGLDACESDLLDAGVAAARARRRAMCRGRAVQRSAAGRVRARFRARQHGQLSQPVL
jgi:hypothetical protein